MDDYLYLNEDQKTEVLLVHGNIESMGDSDGRIKWWGQVHKFIEIRWPELEPGGVETLTDLRDWMLKRWQHG